MIVKLSHPKLFLPQFCNRGVKEGAKLILGGKRVDRKGYFFHPTIFTEVTDDMFLAKEESFGPIMIISKFSSKYVILNLVGI